MKSYKRIAFLVFIFSLILTLGIPLTADSSQKDILKDFAAFISNYGWNGYIAPHYRRNSDTVKFRGTIFGYEFPERDGYWPHVGFYEFVFTHVQAARRFRIEDFKHLFPEVVVWEHHEYIQWRTYYHQNTVYIVYAYPARQDIDTFFHYLKDYFESYEKSDFSSLEEKLTKTYQKDRDFFQAIKIVQSVLKDKGYYRDKVDGIYGYDTTKGLQRFLSKKGFYRGEIDGLFGEASIAAMKHYQRSLGLKTTGFMNLKTAKAMESQETNQ